jgi:hypothetical protein
MKKQLSTVGAVFIVVMVLFGVMFVVYLAWLGGPPMKHTVADCSTGLVSTYEQKAKLDYRAERKAQYYEAESLCASISKDNSKMGTVLEFARKYYVKSNDKLGEERISNQQELRRLDTARIEHAGEVLSTDDDMSQPVPGGYIPQ